MGIFITIVFQGTLDVSEDLTPGAVVVNPAASQEKRVPLLLVYPLQLVLEGTECVLLEQQETYAQACEPADEVERGMGGDKGRELGVSRGEIFNFQGISSLFVCVSLCVVFLLCFADDSRTPADEGIHDVSRDNNRGIHALEDTEVETWPPRSTSTA